MTRRVCIAGDGWIAEMKTVEGRIVSCDGELAFMMQMRGSEVARICRERGWRWVSEIVPDSIPPLPKQPEPWHNPVNRYRSAGGKAYEPRRKSPSRNRSRVR